MLPRRRRNGVEALCKLLCDGAADGTGASFRKGCWPHRARDTHRSLDATDDPAASPAPPTGGSDDVNNSNQKDKVMKMIIKTAAALGGLVATTAHAAVPGLLVSAVDACCAVNAACCAMGGACC